MINQVLQGDCLELLATLPDNSVDLICTDPPYFRVKKEAWDNHWKTEADFLAWLRAIALEWRRVLKPNGSLYCFASTKMAAKVEVMLGELFNVVNRITWQKPKFATKAEMFRKDDLRGFFPASESIIFAEHYGADNIAKGEAGYGAKCDELRGFVFEPLRAYLDGERRRAGVAHREIIFHLGMGGHDSHFFSPVQWKLPLEEQYQSMGELLGPGYFTRPYKELRQQYEDLRQQYEDLRQQYEDLRQQYEDLRRPFNVSAEVPYTDVWTFPTVQSYKGKHPCEKPTAMLEHIISASSRPGSLVLDCFGGSGATAIAAQKLGRSYCLMELDPHWVATSKQRIGDGITATIAPQQSLKSTAKVKARSIQTPQLSLFDLTA